MSRILRVLVVVVALSLAVGCNSDYSAQVKASTVRVLGPDFKGYHFWATPVGNFGIGTMYLKTAANQNPSQIVDSALIAISDTYFVSTLSATEKEEILKKLFPDGKVGRYSVNEHIVSGVDFSAALPNIAQMLNVNGNLDFKKDVHVDLQAGDARARKLNWTELSRSIKANQIQDDIKTHLLARDVIIAMDDILLDGYKATVKLNASTNAGLDAALNQNVGKTLGDASAKFSFTRTQDGTYEVTATESVVVATLFREIPSGVLEEKDTDEFPITPVKKSNFGKMRDLYLRKLSSLR